MKRRRFHRIVFALAYSALDPQWLFRFADMPLSNHPEIFACLGMVEARAGDRSARITSRDQRLAILPLVSRWSNWRAGVPPGGQSASGRMPAGGRDARPPITGCNSPSVFDAEELLEFVS